MSSEQIVRANIHLHKTKPKTLRVEEFFDHQVEILNLNVKFFWKLENYFSLLCVLKLHFNLILSGL